MPNYAGNPNIAEYGKATRFGAGNSPFAAQKRALKPWSIRNAAKRIARIEFDCTKPITLNALLKAINPAGNSITIAESLVAIQFIRGINGDFYALEWFTNAVDGKLTTKETSVRPSLAELIAEK